jgi:hypothetical protein
MTNNLKINIAALLIFLYGAFVLINALVYYFVLFPGETDIFRGILRVVGTGLIVYYLYKRNKYAYWFALIGSCILSILGILSVILVSTSMGFDVEGAINLIPVGLLIGTFILLLQTEVRKQFR